MVRPCMLTFGMRGSGKTLSGTENDLMALALERQYATIYLDIKGTSARRMAGQLEARGLGGRCRIDIASKVDRCLSWPFRREVTELDPVQRQIEEELADEEFLQLFFSAKGLKGNAPAPYTRKYLNLGIRLWSRQPFARHLSWLRLTLQPGSGECLDMAQQCGDDDAVEQLRAAAFRSERNPAQWEIETGASARMFEVVKSPVVWARHGNSFSWEEALDKKLQTYFDLSGVAPAVARTLGIAAYMGGINVVRQRFARTGKPSHLMVYIEEAGAGDFLTPFLLNSMQADREAGVSVAVVTQTPKDFGEDEFEQLMGLCDIRRYYRMSIGIDRAADDLADATYSPDVVLRQRERLEHAGHERVETTSSSEGVSVDHERHERHDRRTGTSVHFLPKYRVVVDYEYKTPQLFRQEFRTSIVSLNLFQRIVRDLAGVRKETVQPLGEAWPMGLTEIRTNQAIARIRSGSSYRAPAPPPEPAPLPAPPPETPRAPRGKRKRSTEKTDQSAAERFRGNSDANS